MKEKTLVPTFTLVASLASYHYAKTHGKDVVPYVMIGGFIGMLVGELIISSSEQNQQQKELSNGNRNH